jgi:hypothetical protein
MRYIIDRFEGDKAILEDEELKLIDIDIAKLPRGVRESDVLIERDGVYIIDIKQTAERKKLAEDMLRDILRDRF